MRDFAAKTEREYQARYDREYFAGWLGTPWETVKRIATWSKDHEQAKWMLAEELMELTKSFGRLVIRSREKS